jgi:predicted phage-related endonuclease
LKGCGSPLRRRTRHDVEAVVAARYEEETGRELTDPKGKIQTHPSRDWQGATVDRFARDRIVELKAYRFLERGDDGWGEPGTDQVPPYILCQVQHQMAVTGHRVADVAVLVGGQDLDVYTVERSAEFVERLVHVEVEFWKFVVRREEPPPDWEHPATPALMDVLHKPVAGKVVDLSDEWQANDSGLFATARWYLETAAKEKAAREEKERLRAELLHAVGDAERTLLPDGFEIVRKTVKRKAYQVAASEYVTLSVKEPK